jgi:NADPH-dependent 2,4-dienoyl-CoA reductase/sulfur reductase-like enzyme
VRVEHWQIAADHADRLAKYWTSGQEPSTKLLPYFWSDQYGKKIQMLGHPHMHDEVVLVEGNSQDPKWLALYSRNGIVSGVIALSHPRGLSKSKVLLDRITSLDDALALAPWAS